MAVRATSVLSRLDVQQLQHILMTAARAYHDVVLSLPSLEMHLWHTRHAAKGAVHSQHACHVWLLAVAKQHARLQLLHREFY